MMEIVTGKQGKAHIKAADIGSMQSAILGSGNYVLPTAEKLAAEVTSQNNVRIFAGDVSMNGRVGRIRTGDYEDIKIQNGASGYKRCDLLVVAYKSENGTESMTLKLYAGTPTTGTPELPSHVEGNILEGDNAAEFPVYRIDIDGISIPVATPLFEEMEGIGMISKDTVDAFVELGMSET